MWLWIVLFVGALLVIGGVVDWRRRHSLGGSDRRSDRGSDYGGHHSGGASSCGGGGCGGGGP